MESKRWVVWIGSLAVALLLFGASAAFADSQQCYSCGSLCPQQGVEQGIWYLDPATQQYRRVGGTGWRNCSPGSPCFQEVLAACNQKCQACLAAGGHFGPLRQFPPPHPLTIRWECPFFYSAHPPG